MTGEQRLLLSRRLESAAAEQPEIVSLRRLLLDLGGIEFVPAPNLDPDVAALLDHGSVMTGEVVSKMVDEGYCHENVAELWSEHKTGLGGIGTGYALSSDGLWRQHSWGVSEGRVIETTEVRVM